MKPLHEVFGFLPTDMSEEAKRHRRLRLCPFGNVSPNCTKDKASDPLGVCSVVSNGQVAITCPIRFREGWQVAEHAAEFFFDENDNWTSLTEVRIKDVNGKAAGNIDVVLVKFDEMGQVIDFGALEIQAVYISGNVRNPFVFYMNNQDSAAEQDWSGQTNYPRPDYLSSSRKRLIPQLMYKGGILHTWDKKIAVALDSGFFLTLPEIVEVDKSQADIIWLVYDIPTGTGKQLELRRRVYTKFSDSMEAIAVAKPSKVEDFLEVLQSRIDKKLTDIKSQIDLTSLDGETDESIDS